jgi:CRISPR-associated protein Cmr1
VRALLDGKRGIVTDPPYSAFSQNTRVDLVFEATSPYEILDQFGHAELMYRSWGKNGRVLGQDSEKRFPADHDWSKGLRPHGFHPRRVVFGLPHNYGKGPSMEVSPEKHDRRASPLLFHVQALGKHSFGGVTVLLQSAFLPAGEMINAGGAKLQAKIEWSLLRDFLDGADKSGNVRFPGKVTI